MATVTLVFLPAHGDGPWPLQSSAVLDVPSSATLREIIEVAKADHPRAFKLREDARVLDIWVPVLIQGDVWQPLWDLSGPPPPMVSVDPQGHATWVPSLLDYEKLTLDDIRRAAEAGVLDARTDTIGYCEGGYGNGDVPALFDVWQAFVPWLQVIVGIVGSVALDRLCRLLGGRWRQWRERKATPETFLNLIMTKRTWNRERLARLLDVTDPEADDILTALGYQHTDETVELMVHNPDADTVKLLVSLLQAKQLRWFEALSEEQAEAVARENPELDLYLPSKGGNADGRGCP